LLDQCKVQSFDHFLTSCKFQSQFDKFSILKLLL
jgi:hypothetical protein